MTVVKDFNEGEYKFNLSTTSSKEWTKLMLDILVARLDSVKGVKITGSKITIRGNVAKVLLAWEDVNQNYHELTFHLDEFGRKSKNYQDLISQIWQNNMSNHYGEDYNQALSLKLDEINTKTV